MFGIVADDVDEAMGFVREIVVGPDGGQSDTPPTLEPRSCERIRPMPDEPKGIVRISEAILDGIEDDGELEEGVVDE
jgi:hypothetical protein